MKDITLPLELADLSLNEIGVIFLVMAMPSMSNDTIDRWENDNIFMETLKDMMNEEIIIVKDDGVDIDLTWL